MTSRSSAGRAPDDDPSTSAAIVVDDAMSPTELAHEEIVLKIRATSRRGARIWTRWRERRTMRRRLGDGRRNAR